MTQTPFQMKMTIMTSGCIRQCTITKLTAQPALWTWTMTTKVFCMSMVTIMVIMVDTVMVAMVYTVMIDIRLEPARKMWVKQSFQTARSTVEKATTDSDTKLIVQLTSMIFSEDHQDTTTRLGTTIATSIMKTSMSTSMKMSMMTSTMTSTRK